MEIHKAVHFVCFDEFVEAADYIAKLAVLEKVPCKFGANYLLGFLAEFTEKSMPPELTDKFLVAADPQSTIFDSSGNRSFLCCRREKSYRIIEIASGRNGWAPRWAFLVENSRSLS